MEGEHASDQVLFAPAVSDRAVVVDADDVAPVPKPSLPQKMRT